MLKVIIADDEEYERDYLKKTISEKYEGILEVVYAAANGADALEKAKDLKPDICLFDIKMPRLDGLEATSQLIEALPDVQVVIVSAYDDFAYAKEAMKLGIKDFLVKPYLDKELTQTIDKIIADICGFHKKSPADKIMDVVTGDIDRDVVWKLALGRLDEDDIKKELSLWGIGTTSYKCVVFYYDGIIRIGEKGCDIVKGIFHINGTHTLVSRLFDLMVVYVFSEDEDAFIELNQSINKTRNYMKESGTKTVYCGVSGIYPGSDTAKGFEEAAGFIGNYAENTVQSGLNKVIGDVQSVLQNLDKASFAIASRNREQSLIRLSEIRSVLSSRYTKKDLNDIYLRHLMVILRGLNRKLGIRVTNEDIDRLTDLFEDENCDIEKITEQTVDELMERSVDVRINHNVLVVRRARDYIRDHYSEQINLQIVADAIDISPGHLSKCFKNIEKKGFSEYLTSVRLEKAKELMRKADKSIQEIAYDVGFSDSNYFGKCFKKNEGITPKEYCAMLIMDAGGHGE
ncbi:MAG: response regulator [Lachnospiraceae bacterium]|nr:response regulator [Lachnospiraceae bacterium]